MEQPPPLQHHHSENHLQYNYGTDQHIQYESYDSYHVLLSYFRLFPVSYLKAYSCCQGSSANGVVISSKVVSLTLFVRSNKCLP
eukprot:Awhi_evm1s11383